MIPVIVIINLIPKIIQIKINLSKKSIKLSHYLNSLKKEEDQERTRFNNKDQERTRFNNKDQERT